MTGWDTDTYDEAWRRVWAQEGDGVDHCLAMLDAVPDRGTVIDVGCGVGRLAVPFADAHPDVTVWAVDVSPTMLEFMPARPNVTPVLCDGRSLPSRIAPRSLDGAWSVLTFQHVPPAVQHAYLAYLGARLRPGGVAVVQFVPDGEPGPLNHPVDERTVVEWVERAGLDARIVADPEWPTWRWLTAVRP